jgi:polysaccharide biosynthesis protein PslG
MKRSHRARPRSRPALITVVVVLLVGSTALAVVNLTTASAAEWRCRLQADQGCQRPRHLCPRQSSRPFCPVSPSPSPSPSPGSSASASSSASPSSSTSASSSPRPSSTPTKTDGYIGGVALGGDQPNNTRRAQDYAKLREANVTWVRTDVDWQWVEENRGTFNWNVYDPTIKDIKAAGFKHLAILHTVPTWANDNAGNYAPPADLSRLTEFCYQAVRHYIGLGTVDYEIGNEVNLHHPGVPNPTGASYTKTFLKPCVSGVRKAASEKGTKVNIVLGSLVPTEDSRTMPTTFLEAIYDNGGKDLFDTGNLHPYTLPNAPEESTHLTKDARALHKVMAAHGDGGKKIWATEYGFPTAGEHSVTESQLASHVGTALDLWYANSFAGPAFWYTARDRGQASSRDPEDHFGLMRVDGTPKAALKELRTYLRR